MSQITWSYNQSIDLKEEHMTLYDISIAITHRFNQTQYIKETFQKGYI